MTEKTEVFKQSPIVLDVAEQIKLNGEYRRMLDVSELWSLTDQLMNLWMVENKSLQPSVTGLTVEITDNKKINFEVEAGILQPEMGARVRVNWKNDPKNRGWLVPVGLTVEPEMSREARYLLLSKNQSIENIIKPVVMSPVQTMGEIFRNQLRNNGVELLGMGLIVEENQRVQMVVKGKSK